MENNTIPKSLLASAINPYHRRPPLERLVPSHEAELYESSFFFPHPQPFSGTACPKIFNAVPQPAKRKDISKEMTIPSHHTFTSAPSCHLRIIHIKLCLRIISDLHHDLVHRHVSNDAFATAVLRPKLLNTIFFIVHSTSKSMSTCTATFNVSTETATRSLLMAKVWSTKVPDYIIKTPPKPILHYHTRLSLASLQQQTREYLKQFTNLSLAQTVWVLQIESRLNRSQNATPILCLRSRFSFSIPPFISPPSSPPPPPPQPQSK